MENNNQNNNFNENNTVENNSQTVDSSTNAGAGNQNAGTVNASGTFDNTNQQAQNFNAYNANPQGNQDPYNQAGQQQFNQAGQQQFNQNNNQFGGAFQQANQAFDQFGNNLDSRNVSVMGKTFSALELVTYVSAIIGIISLFLPFYSVSALGYSQNVNLISSGLTGFLALGFIVAVCILVYLKIDSIAVIVAGVDVLFTGYIFLSVTTTLSGFNVGSYSSLIKHGYSFGALLYVIAVVGLLIGAILTYRKNRNNSQFL